MLKLFFTNRNFRRLLLFSTSSGIGGGMFRMFMMWAIHATYQNPMYTGIAGFMFGVPFVVSFIVGPFVDRWKKAKVLRIVGFVQLCVAVLILVSHVFFYPGAWLFIIAILIFSIASLFAHPAYTALLPKIVDGKDLITANAFMRITGLAGGLTIGTVLYMLMREGADFALVYSVTAVLLFIALLSAMLLHSNKDTNSVVIQAYLAELKIGFAFVKRGLMLPLIVAAVAMSFFADIAYVNLPMFAEIHIGTASGYIILSALALVGGLIGSYISRAIGARFEVWKILVGCFILAGIARIVFVNVIPDNLTRAIWIYILYVGLGSTIGIFYHTLVQKLPPQNLISRVDTTITSLSAVTAAAGALVGGILGTHLYHVDMVFIIQGGSYIAIGVLLCFCKSVRALPKVGEIGSATTP